MKRPKRDPVREDRIHNEAIVDARPEEQAMSWYYYLEGKISFPFQARCVATKAISPLRKGESIEVLRMSHRGCLRARHACANPLAGAQDGRSSFATRRHEPGRIHQRSHRRLALLGGAGLLPLIYARLPKAHPVRWETISMRGRPGHFPSKQGLFRELAVSVRDAR